MKLRNLGAALSAAAVLLATGCAGVVIAPVVPPPAFIYTDFQAPLDTNTEQTKVGAKTGESEVINILGIVSTGDGSVAKAAANGDITMIRHVDYKFFSVFGLYSRYTTVVNGD